VVGTTFFFQNLGSTLAPLFLGWLLLAYTVQNTFLIAGVSATVLSTGLVLVAGFATDEQAGYGLLTQS